MSEPGRRYVSYLLRLWQVQAEQGLAWRASLEDTRTSERHGFASLEDLWGFLCRLTGPFAHSTGREENER